MNFETLRKAGELVELLACNKGCPILFDKADIALLQRLLAEHWCLMTTYRDLEELCERAGWDGVLPVRQRQLA